MSARDANIALRWVFLSTFSFWAALLLRDVFTTTWARTTGFYAIGKTQQEVADYKKMFPKYIGLQFLLAFLVLMITAIMAVFWEYEDFNGFGSFNV